jgi:hypothetical protein
MQAFRRPFFTCCIKAYSPKCVVFTTVLLKNIIDTGKALPGTEFENIQKNLLKQI